MQSGSLLKQNLHGEQGLNQRSSQGNRQRRPYVYELDQLRVITALSVIAVHVLSFTAFLNAGPLGTLVQNGVLDAFLPAVGAASEDSPALPGDSSSLPPAAPDV